jgi:DNA-binding NarL/FixJ family response regulator
MSADSRVRIVIAEDHLLVREGLRLLIQDEKDMEIVAEATDGAEAVALCRELLPSLAVVDVSMPMLDGVRVAEALSAQAPSVRVLMLTRHDDLSFVRQALKAGAAGYVLKQNASTELIRAIRLVASGAEYVDATVRAISSDPAPEIRSVPMAVDVPLSDVEEQVLRLVARAHSNQQIATRLALDREEVARHKSEAMRRLGLSSRGDVIRYAAARGWS